ncbi:uncharacterized protein METZ01_LOCUS181603, partial [marine metagenome]
MKTTILPFSGQSVLFAGLLATILGSNGCVTPTVDSPDLFNGKDLDGWQVTDFAGGGKIEVKDG